MKRQILRPDFIIEDIHKNLWQKSRGTRGWLILWQNKEVISLYVLK